MKTFKQYLGEESIIPEEMQVVINGIKKSSKPFLKMIDNNPSKFFIVSGRKDSPDFIRSIRKGRNPLDTNIIVQTLIDDIFEKKFGIRFRENSIFVLSNLISPSVFGTPHLIFPIGKFKFLWSPIVKDLTRFLVNIKELTKFVADGSDINQPNALPILQQAINKANYKNKDLKSAIMKNVEIMINGNKYYGISIKEIEGWGFKPQSFLEELKNQI